MSALSTVVCFYFLFINILFVFVLFMLFLFTYIALEMFCFVIPQTKNFLSFINLILSSTDET